MQLLREDMCATMSYWLKREESISKAITDMPSSDQFSRGAVCSLRQLKWEAELHLTRTVEAFCPLIIIPSVVLEKHKLILSGSESDMAGDDDAVSSSDSSCDSDSDCEDYDNIN